MKITDRFQEVGTTWGRWLLFWRGLWSWEYIWRVLKKILYSNLDKDSLMICSLNLWFWKLLIMSWRLLSLWGFVKGFFFFFCWLWKFRIRADWVRFFVLIFDNHADLVAWFVLVKDNKELTRTHFSPLSFAKCINLTYNIFFIISYHKYILNSNWLNFNSYTGVSISLFQYNIMLTNLEFVCIFFIFLNI